MLPKLYCVSLWKSIHVDVDGYLTPCCVHINGEDKNKKIEDVDNIEEVLLVDHEKYRQQLINGEWPDGCNQCRFAEEEGRDSKRLQDLHEIPNLKLPPEEVSLEYLQLKTGRVCNLKCTICTPACSTSIANELYKNGEIDKHLFDYYNKNIEWATNLSEYKKMNSKHGYTRIDISGGEPLLNKTHFQWLDSLPNPENTHLLYNTNGTQKPTDYMISIWKKFKGLRLAFSIDSYEERYEKLRVGAKWNQVLDNLKFCQKLIYDHFDLNTSNISIVLTLHSANVMDVFELNKILTTEVNFNGQDPINFNYLFYPEHLAIHNMPKERIQRAITFYEKKINTLPKDKKVYRESLNILNSMKTFLKDKEVLNPRPQKIDHRGKLDSTFLEK